MRSECEEKGVDAPQLDHSGTCVHAAQIDAPADPVRLEPGPDIDSSVKRFAESLGMSEPLQERTHSINRRMSLSLRHLEVKSEVFSTIAAQSEAAAPVVWGWLEPGSSALPHIQLRGNAVALGRGSGMHKSHAGAASPRGGSPRPSGFTEEYPLSAMSSACLTQTAPPRAVWSKDLTFVDILDGRVSRLHCILRPGSSTAAASASSSAGAASRGACLLDVSSNGTFINGEPASASGRGSLIKDGDRLSLVLSVTPLVEHFFIYHAGEHPADGSVDWAPARSIASAAADDRQQLASQAATELRMRSLQRMATSKYTTARMSTLEDFQCQICLSTLRDCVAIEPCGHNFCAACLSHHFASQLLVSSSLSCPLRCATPGRIVVNTAVRALIQRMCASPQKFIQEPLSPLRSSLPEKGDADSGPGLPSMLPGSVDEESDVQMSSICPLDDELLPVAADGLRLKQVNALLSQIRDSEKDADVVIVALETLAKIAWNDDEVRAQVGEHDGVTIIVRAMKHWGDSGGVQCNGCLAIVSLVRAESEVCQANQWLVARSGGLEAIAGALRCWRDYPMVQLCALLCMVPLALDNNVLQAHLAQLSLGDIFEALDVHQDQADLQAKGLVALGVLGQGDDTIHDTIRSMQLQIGVPRAIARALRRWGNSSDEVIWAALFALAVLVREGSTPHSPALRAIAACGMLPILNACMSNYKAKAASRTGSGDEMIISAGDFLVQALKPAARRMAWERGTLCLVAFAALGVCAWRCRAKPQ
ncbi:hypothetical protein CVIRNUC_002049 [Coccomyxa viridis]|uniref:E3 ubiquitin-protein ligase CHFR n=1 Tax=Coccomyxa viridis TaxID=1274662 RepID=A0AAV1HV31_9CHLO|nr:hypothetical protein CVIRNUC_002049 [Coccomyxa viridis]